MLTPRYDPTKMTDLDRSLFRVLTLGSVNRPYDLVDILVAVPVFTAEGRDKISGALARLLLRGMIVELPGRRFYSGLTVAEPRGFLPFSEAEWAQAVDLSAR